MTRNQRRVHLHAAQLYIDLDICRKLRTQTANWESKREMIVSPLRSINEAETLCYIEWKPPNDFFFFFFFMQIWSQIYGSLMEFRINYNTVMDTSSSVAAKDSANWPPNFLYKIKLNNWFTELPYIFVHFVINRLIDF